MIDLVYFNHKPINDIMSNKLKVGMSNPVVSATGNEHTNAQHLSYDQFENYRGR